MNSILNNALSGLVASGVLAIGTSVVSFNTMSAKYEAEITNLELGLARVEAQGRDAADKARQERQQIMQILIERL